MSEIKPTSGFGPLNQPSADSPTDAQPSKNFPVVRGSSDSPIGAAPALASVSGLSKADLQDPAKLDQAVRASVAELIDSQTASMPISIADQKSLADFLSQDPLFRQQVESYLRKAAP